MSTTVGSKRSHRAPRAPAAPNDPGTLALCGLLLVLATGCRAPPEPLAVGDASERPLRLLLARWAESNGDLIDEAIELDPETERSLRALGYIE